MSRFCVGFGEECNDNINQQTPSKDNDFIETQMLLEMRRNAKKKFHPLVKQ